MEKALPDTGRAFFVTQMLCENCFLIAIDHQ